MNQQTKSALIKSNTILIFTFLLTFVALKVVGKYFFDKPITFGIENIGFIVAFICIGIIDNYRTYKKNETK